MGYLLEPAQITKTKMRTANEGMEDKIINEKRALEQSHLNIK